MLRRAGFGFLRILSKLWGAWPQGDTRLNIHIPMQTLAGALTVKAPAGALSGSSGAARSTPSTPLAAPRLGLPAAAAALVTSSSLLLAPLAASSSLLLATLPAAALDLSFAAPDVKASLEARDKAMDFQCKGGMFDCTGDRRDFAKDQYKNFVARMEAKEKGLPVPPPLTSSKGSDAGGVPPATVAAQ